jgi:hypothetical protein
MILKAGFEKAEGDGSEFDAQLIEPGDGVGAVGRWRSRGSSPRFAVEPVNWHDPGLSGLEGGAQSRGGAPLARRDGAVEQQPVEPGADAPVRAPGAEVDCRRLEAVVLAEERAIGFGHFSS